jgi:threonine dehydrogenase-like Zn-dependent dehydrogenase
LCATLGAKLRGAGLIVGVDPIKERRDMARRFGASIAIDPAAENAVEAIKRLTDGRGADVAIEALGIQNTFEAALRSVRPGGTLSSLGVYSGKLVAPYEALYAGLGDQRIVTTLCPGGKERMRRLLSMVQNDRIDLTPLVTHHFTLDELPEAFDLFRRQGDGVMKVAIHPAGLHGTRRALREPAEIVC